MKQGWIQVETDGTKEPLAPKTIADMVYVDESQEKTVKEALAEGFVAVFVHTKSVVNGQRVHNFEGPSGFVGLGRAMITETILPNDQFTLNGTICAAYQGGESLYSTMLQGYWAIFMIDGTVINFNLGGAGNQVRLIAVPSKATLPAMEKENAIGVVTTVAIPSWEINENQPQTPVDDMVWIQTGSASATPFSPTQKNSLMIYPVRGAQYISGSWVDKELYVFQGGQWNGMGVFLYNRGETMTSLTGGYNNYTNDERKPNEATDFARYRITDNTDCTHIELNDQSGWWGGGAYRSTKLKIDLTHYKKLLLVAKNAECSVGLETHANSIWIANTVASNPSDQTLVAASYSSKTGDIVITLDVSDYAGSYFVGFGSKVTGNSNLARSIMDVVQVMLLTA